MKQENKISHVIGFITGRRNNIGTNRRSKDTNLVGCIHDRQKLGSKPSQELWSAHLARGATLAYDPPIYVSAAESEQLVKLLQMVAGDIETNPGPMVSAFCSNVWQFIKCLLRIRASCQMLMFLEYGRRRILGSRHL